jgi:hypothetical protein
MDRIRDHPRMRFAMINYSTSTACAMPSLVAACLSFDVYSCQYHSSLPRFLFDANVIHKVFIWLVGAMKGARIGESARASRWHRQNVDVSIELHRISALSNVRCPYLLGLLICHSVA